MHSLELHKKTLLRKFIDRTISDDERHELEQLALDDPFLFEALEGYAMEGSGDAGIRINDAVEGLSKQERKVKTRGFGFTQIASIAAGLLFVAVMGFVIKQSVEKREANVVQLVDNSGAAEEEFSQEFEIEDDELDSNPEIASNVTEEEPTIIQDKVLPVSKVKISKEQVLEQIEIKESSSRINDNVTIDGVKIQEGKEEISASDADVQDIPRAKSPVKIEHQLYQNYKKADRNEEREEADNVKEKEELKKSEKSYRTVSKRKLANAESNVLPTPPESKDVITRKIAGQILDSDGMALIGANVQVPGTKVGTITNIDGDFELLVPADATQIETSYTGFSTQMVMLGDPDVYKIQMEEGALLDEIVVSSAVAGKSGIVAEPEMGFAQFEDYLRENVVVDDCTESRTLSFEITPTGELRNIQVLDGKNDKCANEAIRLLKSSGNWRSIPPKRTVTTQYIFHFRR